MKNIIQLRFASYGLLIILSLVVVFHMLVITRIVPFDIVWGGRVENESQMMTFEIISIALNLFMLTVVSIHAGILPLKVNMKVIRVVLWIMCILFLVNTIGNLFSNNETEKLIFTPITLVLSIFCWRLAVGNNASRQ